jgi:hypothetical protein
MRIHSYLSILFLPLALVYAISGIAYLFADWDTSNKNRITLYDLEPESPRILEHVEPLLREQLKANNYPIPTGELNEDDEDEAHFEWKSGRSYTVKYRPSSSTKGKAYISIRQKTFYGRLISFHKGDGRDLLDILGASFACLLIFSYLSGVYLAIKIPYLRIGTLIALIVGALLTAWALYTL